MNPPLGRIDDEEPEGDDPPSDDPDPTDVARGLLAILLAFALAAIIWAMAVDSHRRHLDDARPPRTPPAAGAPK